MTPDPLAGLRDWHLPEPVSWWPPAPGWWLLAGLFLIGLVIGIRLIWRRRRRTAARRLALRELALLRASLAADGDTRRFDAGLSRLLRRLALALYPRESVAGLCGAAWLEFLDVTGGQGGFSRGVGRRLSEGVFRADDGPVDPEETEQLVRLAAVWIRANGGRRA